MHRLRGLHPRVPGQRDLRRGRPAGRQLAFIKLNAQLALADGWKTITKRKPAPPDADEWKDVTGKISELIR